MHEQPKPHPSTVEHPKLPENYRAEMLGHVLPGEVLYAYPSMLSHDPETGVLHIDYKTPIDARSREPRALTNDPALMRVYGQDENGALLDGFIADIRLVQPGAITRFHSEDTYSERYDWRPLLGIAYLDRDGNTAYAGGCVDHVRSLVQAVDRMHAEVAKSEQTADPSDAVHVLAGQLALAFDVERSDGDTEASAGDIIEPL